MKKIFSVVALMGFTLGCNRPVKISSKLILIDSIKINQRAIVISKKDKSKQDTTGYPQWVDALIANYVKHTNNKFVKQTLKDSVKEEWVFDRVEKADTANYFVFNVGHDVSDSGANLRYVSDSWICIDSLKRKLYEYYPEDNKVVEWNAQ